jgi:hypothetical protein
MSGNNRQGIPNPHPEIRPVVNRYGTTGQDLRLKEMELSTTHINSVISRRAMWNGGDGLDWRVTRQKIRNKFIERNIDGFIAGTEEEPPLLGPMDPWVNEQTAGLEDNIVLTRDTNYQALRARLTMQAGVAFTALDPVFGNMQVQSREIYREEKYKIQKDYGKAIGDLNALKIMMRKDYRAAGIQRAKERVDFGDRRVACASLFREVFGPSAVVLIEDQITTHQFAAA